MLVLAVVQVVLMLKYGEYQQVVSVGRSHLTVQSRFYLVCVAVLFCQHLLFCPTYQC
jgi:hypothetical protein